MNTAAAGYREKAPDAGKLFFRDLVRRNPWFFMFVTFLGLATAGLFLHGALSKQPSIFLYYFLYFLPVMLFFFFWPVFSVFFDYESNRNAVYATLPVLRRRRARTLWFQRVVLLPGLVFGPTVLVLTGLAAINFVRTDFTLQFLLHLSPGLRPISPGAGWAWLFVARQALALSTLMAVYLLTPKIKGLAVTASFFILAVLVLSPRSTSNLILTVACPLVIILSYVLATRRHLDSPMMSAGPILPHLLARFFPKTDGPLSPQAMGLWWVFRRLFVLAVYLTMAFSYFTLYTHFRERTALLSLVVSIAACRPFAYASRFLWRRFKLVRCLPASRGRTVLAAYAYGVAASVFSSSAAILVVHNCTEQQLGGAFLANSALLGLTPGFLLLALLFLMHKQRVVVEGAVYFALAITTLLLLRRPAPIVWPPQFALILITAAILSAAVSFYWFRRLFIRSDGRKMAAARERVWVEF